MAKITTLLKRLQGARVYFDVNPIIYFIEQNGDFYQSVAPIFDMLGEDRLMAFSGELTLTEILIKPIRDKQQDVIDTYKDLLLDPQLFTLAKVGRDTFLQFGYAYARRDSSCLRDGKPMQILHYQR
jgi:uncharacterized protein